MAQRDVAGSPIQQRGADRWRLLFFGTLAVWLAMPVLAAGGIAQDTIPLYFAGELVGTEPNQVYLDGDNSPIRSDPLPVAQFGILLVAIVVAGYIATRPIEEFSSLVPDTSEVRS